MDVRDFSVAIAKGSGAREMDVISRHENRILAERLTVLFFNLGPLIFLIRMDIFYLELLGDFY